MAAVKDIATARAKRRLGPPAPPKPPMPPNVAAMLQTTAWGAAKPTLANAVTVLGQDEAWRDVLGFDTFAGRIRLRRAPPLHVLDAGKLDVGPWWTDEVADRAATWVERHYAFALTRDVITRAARLVAEQSPTHPIRDFLEKLVWDKKKRLDTWLNKFVRVPDSPYVRRVGAAWMISAVARAFVPGCKADYVLILEGGQRGGKSSALRALCPDEEWFLETGVELGHKDAYQAIRNKWIVELAELDSLSRGEVSKVKNFITVRIDTYRPPYGREQIDQPRGCIFAGTTNDDEYLKDETGGDRWWPVKTTATRDDRLDIGVLVAARDQLWAEAVVRYRKGEKWHFEDEATIGLAAAEQEARRQRDPWEEELSEAFRRNKDWAKRGVSIKEVLGTLGIEPARATKAESMRIARGLRVLGWQLSTQTKRAGVRTRLYFPGGVVPVVPLK